MLITDQMMLDAYEGAGGFEDGTYLVQHVREEEAAFTRRKELATYRNFVAKVVSAYVDTIYQQPAVRSGDDQPWQDLQANADGTGGAIDDLMSAALTLGLLVSPVYLVVDRPVGVSKTRADDLERRPYVVIRLPGEVEAVKLDRLGNVERIVFRETGTDGKPLYRGWDRTRWWLSTDPERDVAPEDLPEGQAASGEHKLGVVPVVRLFGRQPLRKTDVRATAWARGIVAAAVDLFNRHSEARAIERDQTVSTLALPIADASERDRLRKTGITVGAENAVLYDPANGGRPDYFAPPPDPLTLLYQAIADTVQDIYRLANLEFVGGVQQSGVALAFHFQSANKTLAGMAQRCELAEQQLGQLACLWMGKKPGPDLRVVYPKSFQVEDLAARLAEDMDALTMELGDTANRLIRARAARRVLGDSASANDYERIDQELEAGADPYGDRIDKEAGGAAA